jgi:type VI secretion system secreted protein VgrG
MHISNHGIELLKEYEGVVIRNRKHVIYDDKTGAPVNTNEPLPRGATIGYGHLIKPGEDFSDGISETAATELLRSDIATAERAVQDNISAPLSQNQFDALVIFAYNIGNQNFASSTVVKYINNPDFHSSTYPTMDAAWRAWSKSGGRIMPGLANRRDMELKLFHTI